MNHVFMAVKGMVVGLTMLIPGVSGGTMAVLMGIFDDLVNALGSLLGDFKNSFKVLLPFGIGIVLGILIFSNPIVFMLDNFLVPTMFLFMGAVIGGIPALIREADVTKRNFTPKHALFFFVGVIIVLLINFLPKDTFTIQTGSYMSNFIVLFISGAISAVAFVLPGISGSYMLLLLGMYDTMMKAVTQLDIALLVPLLLGILIGVVCIGKLMRFLLNKYREMTYMVIMGFVISSVFELYPGLPQGLDIILSILMFAAGLIVIMGLSRWEEKKSSQ